MPLNLLKTEILCHVEFQDERLLTISAQQMKLLVEGLNEDIDAEDFVFDENSDKMSFHTPRTDVRNIRSSISESLDFALDDDI